MRKFVPEFQKKIKSQGLEKFVDIDGQRVHMEITGSGPAFVLMHGWGCTLETVRSVAAVASQTHTVYNIDLPGFGQSPEPEAVWTVEDYARLIDRLMQEEGIVDPVIAGHSFGGRVSIVLGAEGKVKPSALVLIDAAGVKPRRSLKYYLKVYSFKVGKRLALLFLGKKRGGKVVERWRSRRGSADYASSSPRMRAIMSSAVNEDLKHYMPSIKAEQTLLIWGENDTATPLSDGKTMERLIPHAALVTFEGCGHYSFLDNRPLFAAVLGSFLSSLTPNDSEKKQ